jgi:hypothetical protein
VAGEVVAVGEGVTTVATGDRVYIHCDFSCGRCEYGLEGDEAACTQYGVLEVSHDGGYAEWVVTPVRNTFALAESLSFETAAAAGAVYLTAYRMLFSRGALRPGETVLAAGDDRAVDHDVQSATLLDSDLHQPVDFAPPRRVHLDEDRCPTVLRDQLVGGHAALTGLGPDVSDHDARLLGGEGQRHRAAQPGGAARHHNRLPF